MDAPVKKYSRQALGIKPTPVIGCQRKTAPIPFLAALLIISTACPAISGEYDRVAFELGRAAQNHGKVRVAILPFQSVGKKSAVAGAVVSEKLVAAVMSRGELEVVERTLLSSVMREQKLMHSGAVDIGSIKELGRILGVDALIAGTVLELQDGRFEVNSRLIDTQTARVLGAVVAKVEKDWAESLFDDFSSMALPSLADLDVATPAFGEETEAPDCGQAASDLDVLDHSILDIKARYWAGRLQDQDIERGSLKKNPGSEIHDPETRHEFYRTLRNYFEDRGLRRVTDPEFMKMHETQKEIDRLAAACGLTGA
jgi:TolB-like protein